MNCPECNKPIHNYCTHRYGKYAVEYVPCRNEADVYHWDHILIQLGGKFVMSVPLVLLTEERIDKLTLLK